MNNNWQKVKLSEIIQLIGGGTPKTTNNTYWNGNIPWLSVVDFNDDNRYVTTTEKTITELGLQNSTTHLLDKGDIIISARGTVGALAQLATPMAFNQSCYGIKATERSCNDFLYYLLKNSIGKLKKNTHGSVFNTITRDTFSNIVVSIPPLAEQRKIAGVLSALDDKIELNNKINRNLEAQAQAIFKSWFIDFEPFKNGKFIDSELGKIPEGWVCKKLKDFVEIKRGSSPRPIQDYLSGSGYNWLKISDATSESSPFIFNIKEHIKKSGISQTVYLVAGELVLSNSATPGIPKFLDVNTCIHDGWLWFSNSKLSYEFLYLFFLHKRRDFISLGNGSVFTNLKTDIVKDALFVYPNKAVMDEFDKITKTIFENIKIRSRESQRLTQLRDALLPKLMSGEIDVTDIAV